MEHSELRKIHEEAKRLNAERAMLYSRQRLMGAVTKKMKTAMIGAIASCEELLGFLWGHSKDPDERTAQEEEMYKLWQELRTMILDKGNIQQRAAMEEIANYTISFNRYKTEFIIKRPQQERDNPNG